MLYDRKIKYLDYYEGGTKVNGGGFAKLEVRDNTLRIELMIRGLRPTDSFERDIVLQGAEKEETLGQIRIQNGCGHFRYSCDVDQEIGATGISYSDLCGIRISIGGTREILCRWDNVSGKRRITPPEENTQKPKTGLRESKREPLAESYADNKEDFETSVHTESEQIRDPKLEKTKKSEGKRNEAKKEGYGSIEDNDRKEEKRADIDGERQEDKNGEDRDREEQEDKNGEDKDGEGQESKSRENKDREGQEGKDGGSKDREGEEGKSREDKDREGQESKSREGKDREGQESKSRGDKEGERKEEKNRANKDRERHEEKNRERQEEGNRECGDREVQDDNENKEADENIKKDNEKRESLERGNKGLENRRKDMISSVQPGSTEIQAQGATVYSNVMSPQFAEDSVQTVLQSEERPDGLYKDKLDMIENNHAGQPDGEKAPVKLMEDKWQQLSSIYPHIQPFRDERDYLSLTPSDFVLFPDRFYRAVNNSFLLHGYYNYHHLILARIERRGEILYYIGVPGNYFEREKQVAIMFGFESFECETEPAKTGDFGYYMMRTEL